MVLHEAKITPFFEKQRGSCIIPQIDPSRESHACLCLFTNKQTPYFSVAQGGFLLLPTQWDTAVASDQTVKRFLYLLKSSFKTMIKQNIHQCRVKIDILPFKSSSSSKYRKLFELSKQKQEQRQILFLFTPYIPQFTMHNVVGMFVFNQDSKIHPHTGENPSINKENF